MPLLPDLIRLALLMCILGMAFLAAFFLRGRQLTLPVYACWGLLALLLPIIGPFLVIWIHPGRKSLR